MIKRPDEMNFEGTESLSGEISEAAPAVHEGHRRRMLERFATAGLEGFQEHEILEMLLYYAISRKNTNPLAHRLVSRFGSLRNVLDASINDLMEIEGITRNTAVLLKLIPKISAIYAGQERTRPLLDSSHAVRRYFYDCFLGSKIEQLRAVCVDSSLRVAASEVIGEGSSASVSINKRALIDFIVKSGCSLVFIAHNHPLTAPVASQEDIAVTRLLLSELKAFDIKLLDHVIVGQGKTTSMKESGYFSFFE